VVDDEAGRLSQALGAQPGAVTVARHDQQGGVLRGGYDFSFGEAAALDPVRAAAQPGRGGVQQFAR
jgi:hypothetical protein